jgi:hypothetical protein
MEILITRVKKITGTWKRKQAKKVVKKANRSLWRYKVDRGIDNVRVNPDSTLQIAPDTRLMKKHSRKKD